VAFATGRYDLARTHARRYAEIFSQGAAEGLLLAARCALLSHEPDGAREELALVDGVGRRGRAIAEVLEGKASGIGTVVEMTPIGLGRRP
jgi:predicted metal-dependent phosphotriesterase family hydrolase